MTSGVDLRARYLPLAVGLLLLSACGGAMGQVQTSHAGATDKGSLASALDAPLAVGAVVRPALHFDIRGSAAPPTHLLSARTDIVDIQNGLLVGKSSGVSAILVAIEVDRQTASDTVVDIFHVWVRAADRLEVHGIDASGADLGPLSEPIELLVGDAVRLVPHPYAGSDRLVGVGTSTWTVDPPIALVLHEGMPNRVRLVARQVGVATVKIDMLGATSQLNLKVVQ
jgi:hypothetical protein